MKSYAHPIEGTDEWCHEHEPQPRKKEQKPPPVAPESSSEGIEEETSVEPPSIDMDWVGESLDKLRVAKPEVWNDLNILSFIKTSYKIEAESWREAVRQMSENQAKHFVKRIQEAIDKI